MHSIRILLALLLLLQSAAESSGAEPLGRLFFSPAERQQMDRRQQEDRPALPPPTLDGIITRSAGTPTVFLDGKAVSANPAQIHMHQGKANVRGADGRVHRLQVGDPPSVSSAR